MDLTKALKNIRIKLKTEAWIKSALAGVTAGAAANLLCSLAFLFFGVKAWWISALLLAAVTAIATPIAYKKYAPTTRQVAARVDELGLEERVLTATQYENDDSYIARLQRADAMNALRSVNESLIHIAVSVPMIVICAGVFLAGVGTTTASALVENSILASIEEKIEEEEKEKDAIWWNVEYEVENDEGGYIEGDTNQRVKQGESAEMVEAVADEGYYFAGWSDEYPDAIRTDKEVNDTIRVYAIFLEAEEGDGEDGDGDGETGKGEDKGEGGDSGLGNPSDGDGNGAGDGAGGSSLPNNQVFDGNSYYGDFYGDAAGDAGDAMGSNPGMSSGETGAIDGYFSGIAK